MQRADRDHPRIAVALIDKTHTFRNLSSVQGAVRESNRIFAQRMHIFRPVIGQHQGDADPAGQPESARTYREFLARPRPRQGRAV